MNKNNIELENSFSEYVLNELVTKLRELDPEDYDINNVQNYDDLLHLLLEDEYTNGCYYLYTEDSEKVFKEYFNDILFICNSFYRGDLEQLDFEASTLLLLAIEHAFNTLLEKAATPDIQFTRAGLDKLASRILDIDNATLEDVVYF